MANAGPNNATLAALLASGVALGGVLAYVLTSSQRQQQQQQTDSFDLLAAELRRNRNRGRPRGKTQAPDIDSDDDFDAGTPKIMKPGKSMSVKASRKGFAHAAASMELDDDYRTWGVQAGFSMEEARKMAADRSEEAMNRTPEQVLGDLQRGNARFWTGQASRPERSAFERRALISKQFPSVAILGCSDSRVPVEIVFDQGLGDMFVIRVAGNCLDTATQASLQYAVHHLKVKVVIVLGHEGCGAVKASQLPEEAIKQEPAELGMFLHKMKAQLDAAELGRIQDTKAADREAVTANVRNQVELLMQDDSMMEKVRGGEVIMLGAFYEISSGIVDFFHEVSLEDHGQPTITRRPSRGVLTRGPSFDDRDLKSNPAARRGSV